MLANGKAIRQSTKPRPSYRRRRFGPKSIQPCLFAAIGLYATLFVFILIFAGLSGRVPVLLPRPNGNLVVRSSNQIDGIDYRKKMRQKKELLSHIDSGRRYKRILTLGNEKLYEDGGGIVHGFAPTKAWRKGVDRIKSNHTIHKEKEKERKKKLHHRESNTTGAVDEVARDCHSMARWQTKFYPTCNIVHELDMTASDAKKDEAIADVLALGGKRMAWRYHSSLVVESRDKNSRGADDEIIIIKTLQWNKNFTGGDFATNQRDAVAMERLSSSPRVVDPYGHCGVTVVNEYGYLGGADNYLSEDSKIQLSKSERLRFARDAALAIADVHAIRGEVVGSTNSTALVHGDVRPWNYVVTFAPGRREKLKKKHRGPKSKDVVLKLHDFNAAKFVQWNRTGGSICRFENNVCNMFRSPDECRNIPQDEKIDVYGLSRVIYFLLTKGEMPLKGSHLTTEERADFVRSGGSAIAASLPDAYGKSDDPSIVAMRMAMIAAERFEPVKRASAANVAAILSNSYQLVRNETLLQGYYSALQQSVNASETSSMGHGNGTSNAG